MENNKRVVLNYMFYKICMFYKVPKVRYVSIKYAVFPWNY
jgi:hypothetical protein